MSKEVIPSPGGSNKFSRLISKIKAALGIVEDGSTASHTIASGKFVTWKGDLYKAKSAIPSGTTLSSSNLQAVSEGGLNELSEQIATYNQIRSTQINVTFNNGYGSYTFDDDVEILNVYGYGGNRFVNSAQPSSANKKAWAFYGVNNTGAALSGSLALMVIYLKV